MSDLSVVFRSGNPVTFGMAKSILEEAEIDFEVVGENSQLVIGMGVVGTGTNFVTGPASILVRAEDADEASELLASLEGFEE